LLVAEHRYFEGLVEQLAGQQAKKKARKIGKKLVSWELKNKQGRMLPFYILTKVAQVALVCYII